MENILLPSPNQPQSPAPLSTESPSDFSQRFDKLMLCPPLLPKGDQPVRAMERMYNVEDEVRMYLNNLDNGLPLETRGIFNFTDLMQMEAEENDPLLEPFLSRSGLSTVAGPPDTGKSTFCRQLAMSVALGLDEACGFKLHTKHQHAIYWNSEDFPAQVKKVHRHQCEGLGAWEVPKLTTIFSYRFPARVLAQALELLLQQRPADLIVLDGYGDLLDGRDGNTNSDVRKVLEPFFSLAAVYKTQILLITHVNKSAYQEQPNQKNLQGGGAFGQKIRCSLEIRNNLKNGLRTITCTKGNELSDDLKKEAYKLEFDPKTFLFRSTNERVSLEATVAQAPSLKKKDEIDLKAIFGRHKEMKRADLLDAIVARYECSISTAERAIKSVERSAYGVYLNPYLDELEKDEIEDPFARVSFD
jgi:hypothetical protein